MTTAKNHRKIALIGLVVALSASNMQAGWIGWLPTWLGGHTELSNRPIALTAAALGTAATGYVAYRWIIKKLSLILIKECEKDIKRLKELQLLQAAKDHDLESVQALVQQGADINAWDDQYRTALYIVACPDNFDADIVDYLITNGAKQDSAYKAKEYMSPKSSKHCFFKDDYRGQLLNSLPDECHKVLRSLLVYRHGFNRGLSRFASKYDLERHMSDLHRRREQRGPAQVYACLLE